MVRGFQLTPETRLAAGHPGQGKEAVLEEIGQQNIVLQILDRLALGVQHPLYSLDDVTAMVEEELEQLEMCLERHLPRTRSG
jgi:hypothetical protein